MYCFSFFFLYLTLDFPAEARHYPHFIIGLLLILTTVRMSHMFRDYRRDHRVINDMGELFEGFLPGQFRSMFIYFILFFVLMYFSGFYAAALIYLFLCLRYFKIPMKYIVLILFSMGILIYCTFDLFLNVPLPEGLIAEEFL